MRRPDAEALPFPRDPGPASGLADRDAERERRAAPRRALDRDVAAEEVREAPADGEAEPRAARRVAATGLGEGLEEVGDLGGGDPCRRCPSRGGPRRRPRATPRGGRCRPGCGGPRSRGGSGGSAGGGSGRSGSSRPCRPLPCRAGSRFASPSAPRSRGGRRGTATGRPARPRRRAARPRPSRGRGRR